MKHTCKNCIFCNLIAKDSRGYQTLCRFRPDELIPGKVERCIMKTPPYDGDWKLILTLLKNTNFSGNSDPISQLKSWIGETEGVNNEETN